MYTVEAEYIAMSTACPEFLPLRDLFKEIANALEINSNDIQAMSTTIWEDNLGALALTNLEFFVALLSCCVCLKHGFGFLLLVSYSFTIQRPSVSMPFPPLE